MVRPSKANQIKPIVESLHAEGIYPSTCEVANRLGKGRNALTAMQRAAWLSAMESLGIQIRKPLFPKRGIFQTEATKPD
jgi:hypothetical protein